MVRSLCRIRRTAPVRSKTFEEAVIELLAEPLLGMTEQLVQDCMPIRDSLPLFGWSPSYGLASQPGA